MSGLKREFLVASGVGILSCGLLTCRAENDNCADPALRFSLPTVSLRYDLPAQITQSEPQAPPALSESKPARSIEVESDSEFRSRAVRSDRFYLTRVAQKAEGGVAGFLRRTLTPEVVHVGRVSVSSPIITAVKRKNPLSLLSAVVSDRAATGDLQIGVNALNVSW